MHPDIAVAKAKKVIAPWAESKGAMTFFALTALAVAIIFYPSQRWSGFFCLCTDADKIVRSAET